MEDFLVQFVSIHSKPLDESKMTYTDKHIIPRAKANLNRTLDTCKVKVNITICTSKTSNKKNDGEHPSLSAACGVEPTATAAAPCRACPVASGSAQRHQP